MALKKKKEDLPPPIDETNIDQVEKEIMKAANDTISSIEKVFASWELSKEKPDEFKERIKNYKWLHGELCKWEKEMLKSKNKDFKSRIKRIWKFVYICYSYRGE